MSERRVAVETARPYEVRIGPGVLAAVAEAVPAENPRAILTDANVAPLHAQRLGPLSDAPLCVMQPGEAAKTLAGLEQVLEYLADAGLDRSATLIALGGGVIGDLGGLSASLFMRGIDVVQCPTTLLAQVDASVGGKTAINLETGKNLAGTFHQPRAVFADTETLSTLPEEELRSGLGEVLKTALVGDEELLSLLEERGRDLLARDPELLAEVVERCVRVKAGIVARDERDAGARRALNLGHTFAHAIEHAAGYGAVPHGVAVGVGLVLALEAGKSAGLVEDAALADRTARILGELGLCASLDEVRKRYARSLPVERLLEGLRHDKKGRAGEPALVLLRRPGEVVLDARVEQEQLTTLLG